jgi:hypothetical protein
MEIAAIIDLLLRKTMLEAFDGSHGRIIAIVRAKYELEWPCIVLVAKRGELRKQPWLRAVQRL